MMSSSDLPSTSASVSRIAARRSSADLSQETPEAADPLAHMHMHRTRVRTAARRTSAVERVRLRRSQTPEEERGRLVATRVPNCDHRQRPSANAHEVPPVTEHYLG
ncbi:unnamed protein product [Cylicocyclus nassatus]|uniref:Uncharacterized protein n=1 Tax=Cylicocyclus nassatus TaxID=53992 RepID=A0AA36M3R5_CYLNA|nr:unnamed protein product [Cylicocyclus nassatus]